MSPKWGATQSLVFSFTNEEGTTDGRRISLAVSEALRESIASEFIKEFGENTTISEAISQQVSVLQDEIIIRVAQLLEAIKENATPEKIALITFRQMKSRILQQLNPTITALRQEMQTKRRLEAEARKAEEIRQEWERMESRAIEKRKKNTDNSWKIKNELWWLATLVREDQSWFEWWSFRYWLENPNSLEIGDFGKVILTLDKNNLGFRLKFGDRKSDLPDTLEKVKHMAVWSTGFNEIVGNHKDIKIQHGEAIVWWGVYVYFWGKELLVLWTSGDFWSIPIDIMKKCCESEWYTLTRI